ncbi:MAG: hypothetical protein HY757_09445 [Nitrospirae bacterium]|nr:hypothetical protein [Nitrospirota bacterium]
MEHIGFEKILSYSANQSDKKEIHEIEGHLATCERCHEIFTGLKSVENTLYRSFNQEKATASCPEDWEIAALVKEDLPADVSDKLTGHIKDCGYCIDRSAVYYMALKLERAPVEAPERWKQKALGNMKAVQTEKVPKATFFQRILSLLPDVTFPLPAAAGLAAALLAIAVVTWIIIPGKVSYTAIASNEKIVVRDSEIPSALGFMGTGETKDVRNMNIDLSRGKIIFRWKPVEGAVGYKFILKDRDKAVYTAETGDDKVVALSKELVETNITYNWLISGKTADDRYFEYTGDFVLIK